MITFLLVLFVALLLAVSAVSPNRSELSLFELERRTVAGDKEASRILAREQLLTDVLSLQKVLSALLLVITVLLSVVDFGWLIGVIVAMIIALEYGAVAKFKLIRNLSQKLYLRVEKSVLKFIADFPVVFKFLRSFPTDLNIPVSRIDSRQELQHLVSESGTVLTSDEKKLIINSLSFNDQQVSTVMTPRGMIDSIKKEEFLGPLILDDLHKIGHSRLPVIDGDIDHVVGILHLRGLLALDIKRSTTAEKAMEPKVYYIRQDQALDKALAAFLRTRHHLFIVVNEYRETVGLLTLEDVLEALIGRKIVDEFDAHDDLRLVALRNPRANNHPEKREDV